MVMMMKLGGFRLFFPNATVHVVDNNNSQGPDFICSSDVIAKFHYTGPTAPDQTMSADYVRDPYVVGSGRARVVKFRRGKYDRVSALILPTYPFVVHYTYMNLMYPTIIFVEDLYRRDEHVCLCVQGRRHDFKSEGGGQKRDLRAERAKKIVHPLFQMWEVRRGKSKQIIISIEYTEICYMVVALINVS